MSSSPVYLKTIAALATSLVASIASAEGADQSCGAGACGKKETSQPKGDTGSKDKNGQHTAGSSTSSTAEQPDAGCGKKDASCAKH
ncbi:hypothetical protein [Bordetella holmesii]|uniref:N-acetyltransferase YedL n=2 Tax=Bordetella holmesii TaxID=35814 RepID=A0A158LZ93_9BORD|nr:hypothetical protein [Bordetella holmesii]AHV91757.1 hypothetical protein D560_1253 [Bordetella holmesii ATCC 51541]AIT25920.1 hypothetical protein D558_1242 [Bordetella holmesii 44057]EWM42654.1 hypothetical protein D556_1249 [Bordetella holmesii 41130]EWM46489.1 hypothetical protein D555_1264 [Bordetella holmesii 35009]EWM50655.1 hypothetical protein D557_0500 [Bordetella holmesii 70147]